MGYFNFFFEHSIMSGWEAYLKIGNFAEGELVFAALFDAQYQYATIGETWSMDNQLATLCKAKTGTLAPGTSLKITIGGTKTSFMCLAKSGDGYNYKKGDKSIHVVQTATSGKNTGIIVCVQGGNSAQRAGETAELIKKSVEGAGY